MMRSSIPRWLVDLVKRHRRSAVIALALGFATAACASLLMFTSGYLISATAESAITLFSIMIPIAFVQIFGLGRPVARYLERIVSHDWVFKITSDLRLSLFRGIDRSFGDPAREKATGEYLGLLADDIGHLQNLYLRVAFPVFIGYLVAIGSSLFIGCFSPAFALVVFALFVLAAGIAPFAALKATKLVDVRVKHGRADEYASLTDDVLGSVDWILAGRCSDVIARHANACHHIAELDARSRFMARAFSLAATIALGCGACLVLSWAGSNFVGTDASARWIAAFALGFFPLIETLSTLPEALSHATAHEDAVVRLDEHVSCEKSNPAETQDRAPTPVERESCGACMIDRISYTYPGATTPTLDDLSLDIHQGQSVAILGRSGAGKTTLARCIRCALKPQSGTIILDGHHVAGGEHDMPEHLAYLGQKPYLFNRTLRENLAIGRVDADDDQLISALEAVGLGAKLSALEDGLDTIVGETGVGFSGGEEHRIALARVLVSSAPIVLVDEPFSALDIETEHELLDALISACNKRTLIVITHHLAEIERFDRVVFIENGRVDLDGSPSELIATSERFRTLLDFDRARRPRGR